jgi:hypothetical protein
MRKHVLFIAAIAVLAFAGLSSAALADVVQYDNAGTWTSVPTGSTNNIHGDVDGANGGGSGTATLTTSSGNITCDTASVDGYLPGPNPNNGSPDDVDFRTTAVDFTSCTDTLAFGNVSQAHADFSQVSPLTYFTGNINSDGGGSDPLTVNSPRIDVPVSTFLGTVHCYYGATTVTGQIDNATSEISFNAAVSTQTGSNGSCPTSGTWTATYELDYNGNAVRTA